MLKNLIIFFIISLFFSCKKEECATCKLTLITTSYFQDYPGAAHSNQTSTPEEDAGSFNYCGLIDEIEDKELEKTTTESSTTPTGNGAEIYTIEKFYTCDCYLR